MQTLQAPKSKPELIEAPEGAAGVRATLSIMTRYVKEFKSNPYIRDRALAITADLPGKAFAAEAEAVQNWVRSNIRFVGDILDVETLQTPDVTLWKAAGDCDDQSVLVASLLESIGHPTRFKAIGFAPNDYEHVVSQAKIGANWVTLETTEDFAMGYEPPGVVAFMLSHN